MEKSEPARVALTEVQHWQFAALQERIGGLQTQSRVLTMQYEALQAQLAASNAAWEAAFALVAKGNFPDTPKEKITVFLDPNGPGGSYMETKPG